MARHIKIKKGNDAVAIGYIRMSTDDQTLSPAVQEEAIKAWAARTHVEVMEIHRDLGKSGGLEPAKRPGLMGALDAVRRLGAGHLVVAKRDRLGRDMVQTGLFGALLEREGARIVSCAGEGTESDDPTARLLRALIDAFAEYERLIIVARTQAAMDELRRKHQRAGQIPFGYRLAPDNATLIEDLAEQKVIWAARGARRSHPEWSLPQIGKFLLRQGMTPRSGLRHWDPTQVRRLLQVPEEVGYNPFADR